MTHRKKVFFIKNHASGMPYCAIAKEDIAGWIDAELDEVYPSEPAELSIACKMLTQDELDALPDI